MKFVPFAKHGNFETKTTLVDLLKTSPAGQTIGQMRERNKLIDALEAAPADGATLEDAQHQLLLNILNARSDFVVTSKDLIAVIDDVATAKAPEKSKA